MGRDEDKTGVSGSGGSLGRFLLLERTELCHENGGDVEKHLQWICRSTKLWIRDEQHERRRRKGVAKRVWIVKRSACQDKFVG